MAYQVVPHWPLVLVCFTGALWLDSAAADDWPQWRGPKRDNVSTESGLLTEWPPEGPPLLWTVKGLGSGIASVSVADGKIFTVGYHRDAEHALALEPQNGRLIWSATIGRKVNENPLMRWLSQRTPTVDEDRIYFFSASGDLSCLSSTDGRLLWRKNYERDFGGVTGRWGCCDYPLVDGERLVCVPGGEEQTIVALNKRTGEKIWSLSVADGKGTTYAASVVADFGGFRQVVVNLQNGFHGINVADGRHLWSYNTLARQRFNSLTPIVRGDKLLATGRRITLLGFARDESRLNPREEYSAPLVLGDFHDGQLMVDGHVFGVGYTRELICFDIESAEIAWEAPLRVPDVVGRGPTRRGRTQVRRRRARAGILTYADGHLYVHYLDGRVALIQLRTDEYVETGAFDLPNFTLTLGATMPVVAGGRLYLRNDDRLFCYDVRADALSRPRTDPKEIVISGIAKTPSVRVDDVARSPKSVFVPTPHDVVQKMLEVAQVKEDELVCDLGSGDGRIVIAAAEKFRAKGIGYEIDGDLVAESIRNARLRKVDDRVSFRRQDIFQVNLSDVDVVTLYLLREQIEKLIPQLQTLKAGARIVSHQYPLPGVQPERWLLFDSEDDGHEHAIYLWLAPLTRSP